jgi:hypothetical protein
MMMIIQLVVPSAPGTNAGHSVSRSKPAQQNLRVSTVARKVFSWKENSVRLKRHLHLIEMRGARVGYADEKK